MTQQVERKRPKLFRMTLNRKLTLGDFKGSLRSQAELKADFAQNMLDLSKEVSSDKAIRRYEKLNEEAAMLREAFDILITVTNHHQPQNLHLWWLEERNWTHEWDIPFEAFERGIGTAISFCEFNMTLTRKYESHYQGIVKVLQDMLIFRRAGEGKRVNLA